MEKSELGDKIRAGRILSAALRIVLQEKTELIKDPEQGDRIGTKAEALVRKWVECALGYEEEIDVPMADGSVGKKKVIHPPDRAYAQLIADRVEGKAAAMTEEDDGRPTAAKKVSRINKERLNKLADDATN